MAHLTAQTLCSNGSDEVSCVVVVIPLEEADAKTMIALFSISIIVKWFINPSVLFLDQKQNHIGHTGDSLATRSLEKNVYCLISW